MNERGDGIRYGSLLYDVHSSVLLKSRFSDHIRTEHTLLVVWRAPYKEIGPPHAGRPQTKQSIRYTLRGGT